MISSLPLVPKTLRASLRPQCLKCWLSDHPSLTPTHLRMILSNNKTQKQLVKTKQQLLPTSTQSCSHEMLTSRTGLVQSTTLAFAHHRSKQAVQNDSHLALQGVVQSHCVWNMHANSPLSTMMMFVLHSSSRSMQPVLLCKEACQSISLLRSKSHHLFVVTLAPWPQTMLCRPQSGRLHQSFQAYPRYPVQSLTHLWQDRGMDCHGNARVARRRAVHHARL